MGVLEPRSRSISPFVRVVFWRKLLDIPSASLQIFLKNRPQRSVPLFQEADAPESDSEEDAQPEFNAKDEELLQGGAETADG